MQFTEQDVNKLMDMELAMLENLRPNISRKLQFNLEERLKGQKQELNRLLGLDKNMEQNRSKYSNILDSQYFEQIFLS